MTVVPEGIAGHPGLGRSADHPLRAVLDLLRLLRLRTPPALPAPRRPRPPGRRAAGAGALAALLLVALPSRASAHGIEVPPQLPAPQWMFGWGAALALVVSFVALAAGWSRPRLQRLAEGRSAPAPDVLRRAVVGALGALGLALFGLTAWAGLTGSAHADDNLAPAMVFVGFWVVVPFVSLLLGDVWRALSPWRTVAALAATLRRRASGRGEEERPLSGGQERLATVLAVGGPAGFGWLELASPHRDDPRLLAWVLLAYAAVMLAGASILGRRFVDRADGFGILFSLIGALAPVSWTGGRMRVRVPGSGIADVRPGPSVGPVIVVTIGVATFDGLSATSVWNRGGALGTRLDELFGDLGLDPLWASAAADTVGLVLCVGLVATVVVLGTSRLTADDDRAGSRASRVALFAPTLTPIAAAYVVAHYVGLFLVEGQILLVRLSNPRGDGSDLFGTAGWTVDFQPLSAELIWYLQVAALVGGHVVALAAAHDLALRTAPDHRSAVRSQVPMLAAMVALTALGLRLVSGSTLR